MGGAGRALGGGGAERQCTHLLQKVLLGNLPVLPSTRLNVALHRASPGLERLHAGLPQGLQVSILHCHVHGGVQALLLALGALRHGLRRALLGSLPFLLLGLRGSLQLVLYAQLLYSTL